MCFECFLCAMFVFWFFIRFFGGCVFAGFLFSGGLVGVLFGAVYVVVLLYFICGEVVGFILILCCRWVLDVVVLCGGCGNVL